ncbi:DUF3486 family protein [Acinetobacter sp. c3-l95]|uniref:DUF3486 family protein n=1 Tax=Acinetobacter sp. c3-l95 TaxID=3342804 RepID=UPI0035B8DBB4
MARATAIDQLNPIHKRMLDDKLFENGFNGYVDLAKWLNELGYEIGKSSVHRYGQKLERKLAAVQASTQAALMIAEATPDDGDARSQALLSMAQTELFNAFVNLQSATDEDSNIDPEKRIAMISKAGKGIAEIVKASVMQKQHAIDVREKAEKAAQAVQDIVKSSGLSDETAALIRAKILGIAE